MWKKHDTIFLYKTKNCEICILAYNSMTTTQVLIEFKKCIAKHYLKNGMLPWEIWFRMSIYLHCEKSKWWYIYNWKMWLVVKLIIGGNFWESSAMNGYLHNLNTPKKYSTAYLFTSTKESYSRYLCYVFKWT